MVVYESFVVSLEYDWYRHFSSTVVAYDGHRCFILLCLGFLPVLRITRSPSPRNLVKVSYARFVLALPGATLLIRFLRYSPKSTAVGMPILQ